MKNIKAKIDNSVKKFLSFAGYVLYIYNRENMNCKLIPLPRIEPTLKIRNTGEVFQLGNPSFYLEGKPLFIVVRGIPYSIEFGLTTVKELFMNFAKTLTENDVEQLKINGTDLIGLINNISNDETLVALRGYSSAEIDAKIHSVYTQRVFRPPKLSVQSIVLIILFVITSCVITYMISSMYYMSVIDGLESTIAGLK